MGQAYVREQICFLVALLGRPSESSPHTHRRTLNTHLLLVVPAAPARAWHCLASGPAITSQRGER